MSPEQQQQQAEGRRQGDRVADSRTGGRKREKRVQQWRSEQGCGAADSGVPPLPSRDLTRSRSRFRANAERVEKGGAFGRAFLSANSEARRLRRMRGEFPGTPPPLSLVKAQPRPPTLLFMVLAFREPCEHSNSTAVSLHFQQRSCSISNSNSRLGIKQSESSA